MKNITFTQYGLKIDGNYTKCIYSLDGDEIVIYGRDYNFLPRELGNIKNGSDSQTDFFENDRVRITKNSPFYGAVLKAAVAAEISLCKRGIKYCEKRGGVFLDNIAEYREKIAKLEKLGADEANSRRNDLIDELENEKNEIEKNYAKAIAIASDRARNELKEGKMDDFVANKLNEGYNEKSFEDFIGMLKVRREKNEKIIALEEEPFSEENIVKAKRAIKLHIERVKLDEQILELMNDLRKDDCVLRLIDYTLLRFDAARNKLIGEKSFDPLK